MSRILVTGAGGFIGSRTVDHLARRGHRVTAVWRHERSRLDKASLHNVDLVQADLCDMEAVERLTTQPFDGIVHAAAYVNCARSPDSIRRAVNDNVLAQSNLMTAALNAGCRRFLYCSTISVYGGQTADSQGYRETEATSPRGIYGWSKLAGEQILELASTLNQHLVAISLRLAGVHGLGRTSGALHAIASAARVGRTIELKEPDSHFRWLLIDDFLASIDSLLHVPLPTGHHVWNLASADVFTLADLAERIRRLCGSDSPVIAFAAPARNEVMNIDRAMKLWGFAPTPLDAFLPGYLRGLAAEG